MKNVIRDAVTTVAVLALGAILGYICYEVWYHFMGGGLKGQITGISATLVFGLVVYRAIAVANKKPLSQTNNISGEYDSD